MRSLHSPRPDVTDDPAHSSPPFTSRSAAPATPPPPGARTFAPGAAGCAACRARRRSTQPSLFSCRARPSASAPGGTGFVIVEPAATYAPAPIWIGATRIESDPMNAPSPMRVSCFFSPS